jgi:hypothetical protein
VSGTLFDDTSMGVLAQNVISAKYTMPAAGSLNFTLGTALAAGAVEARVNGGAFSTVIAATLTTGSLSSLLAGDEIEVRHTQGGIVPTETFLQLDTPGNNQDGYCILTF